MLWKEREKWRINTGEMKVTDGGRERDRKRGTGQKRDRNKGKLKHSHIRGERERRGVAAAGLFQGWLAFPWRQSEGAMSYALVGTHAAGAHPFPPSLKARASGCRGRTFRGESILDCGKLVVRG